MCREFSKFLLDSVPDANCQNDYNETKISAVQF